MRKPKLPTLSATLLILAGCGGHDVYRDESFKEDSPFRQRYSVPAAKACEGAQLAILSQGYKILLGDNSVIYAQKDFQPDDDINVTIEMNVVCKNYLSGSILFANAIQTKYELKKSRQTTSVGIPSVGSISLPMGKTTDSLVKIGGETISDQAFYQRFFTLVRTYLEPLK
ncbi:MAG: DUF2242 domain-containing protein [Proteobacteria bacterium]|nr:DUF2242 domain-containing protein [Pseudomonadota bacterium]